MAAAAVVLLGGCGESVDTAKQTFDRTTVPAGQDGPATGSTGKPKANDPVFSNDELRKLDPCALLSDDLLSALGTPDDNRVQDFGSCSNYMEDKDGKDLSVTVYLGETLNNAEEADQNIGGLPAFESELDDKTACFVNAVTSTNPNIGLRVQIGGEKDQDLCAIGRTVLESVVTTIREDPPERDGAKGSIAALDPCSLLTSDQLKVPLGVDTTAQPYSLHWCNWQSDNINAGVWFRTGYDPKGDTVDPGTPVDLGNGVTVYQTATVDTTATCRLEWRHRSTGVDGADEIIEVDVDNYKPAAGDNGCAAAVEVAKLLVPALPKP
jgi:hypothetical protein